MENILIIGASGQIGSELTLALRERYGNDHVFASDIKEPAEDVRESGPFYMLDVMDDKHLIHFVIRHKITQIYHLAAVLSGNAEKLPVQAWQINMNSLMNVLEIAKLVEEVRQVFWPSSIAVFGPSTPKENTPQLTIMEPATVYGISKLAGERWCEYYYKRYGVDVRSLRYPGLISYKTEAGGGTTDWAVEIFYAALREKAYTCFLAENTRLPMMFMPDAINATIALMEAPAEEVRFHIGYNIKGFNCTPAELTAAIQKHIPDFKIGYAPDFRQEIADTWPDSVDDHYARCHDHWKSRYDIDTTTDIMLKNLKEKLKL
ncbi:MAG: NAD-dependent epimerase/dehydratase family protein [Bacteroidales bacterium]|nr:NAD-dependent epimerase/dehydratase family protein [Bacteroidales bacterium]